MSCEHGNPVGFCDACISLDNAYEAGRADGLEEKSKQDHDAIKELGTQLAAAQATIKQMRGTLDHINRHTPLDYKTIKFVEHALALPDNLDALHEARAQECERLAQAWIDDFSGAHPHDWLHEQAAAHRARKEEK